MILKHKYTEWRRALIQCSVMGKFSAVVHFRNVHMNRTIESRSFITQADAIAYCKERGYIAPFGF